MKICVIGSGLSGMTAAYRLSKSGHQVTVLEKESKTGGLMRSFNVKGDAIPMTYHHIMKFDMSTKKLINELGLGGKFYKTRTKMGFFYNDRIYNLSLPVNIINFGPLSFLSRIKFILFGLKVMMKRGWDDLERISAKEWITRKANKEIYEKMFGPLLKIKFSNDSNNIMARWVGERLKLGESSGPMGYLRGGLEQLLDELEKNIRKTNGTIKLDSDVIRFETRGKKIVSVAFKEGGKTRKIKTDYVIYTGPVSKLDKMAKFPDWYRKKTNGIKYKSTICAVIGLDNKISDYYWINFLNGNFSFGGIIAHSALNPYVKSAKSVFHVFRYLDTTDDLWKMKDKAILDKFVKELNGLFDVEGHVKWGRVFKVKYSKPVYDTGYNRIKLDYETPYDNLFLGGIALFFPKIRNMGSAVETGEALAQLINRM
jgi:protoporphyrinogen oxidase